MRCSLKLFATAMILAVPAAGLAQSPIPTRWARRSARTEIKKFDFMIGPQGKELPPGHGTSKEGAVIFANRCAVCHGPERAGRDRPSAGVRQPGPSFPRPLQGGREGQRELLPVSDHRLGLYQPRDAGQQSGIAHGGRSLCAGRVPVLPQRHHRGKRRDGCRRRCRRSRCRTGMASFRKCRCIRRIRRNPLGGERGRPFQPSW